jgi:hypothetical protein
VKTTLELPDDLLRRTKAEAAHEGRSMKDLVVEALEDRLRRKRGTLAGWRAVFGRASPASVRNMARYLADFEVVRSEDWT